MWKSLPEQERLEYKKMILAFASLTEMFAQKADDDSETLLSPIINSKYQETVFQKVFNASAEDIGNTSFDAAIEHIDKFGKITKYLIGIKTFGISAGAQKIAQFKANHDDWADTINTIRENSKSKTKEQIDSINKELYENLAKSISYIRNMRIDSSESNIQGFTISLENDNIQAVYHILMPSKKGETPMIYVGETAYDKINIEKIKILGCTTSKNPTNFEFTDGNHKYKFTSADSQLYMDFNNSKIVQDKWDVKYADNAYEIFSEIANKIYAQQEASIVESYSWLITNKNNEVELFSGFNAFYGVGSKLKTDERAKRINSIISKYSKEISEQNLDIVRDYLISYLTIQASNSEEKSDKVVVRTKIVNYIEQLGNKKFQEDILKLIFRPKDEIYIPIPNSVKFHTSHPDFFGKDIGKLNRTENNKWKLVLPKEKRKFTLVFDPSGDKIESFITQDAGKAIESYEKQSYLGDWILRKIFQLKEYEPLTAQRLKEIGINGIRLLKTSNSTDIHLQFIWIDKDNLPKDFIQG